MKSSPQRPAPRSGKSGVRRRFERFDPNPVKTVAEVPVSTFSIEVDIASYAFGYDDVIALAQGAQGEDPFGYRAEFVGLVRLARSAAAMAPQAE